MTLLYKVLAAQIFTTVHNPQFNLNGNKRVTFTSGNIYSGEWLNNIFLKGNVSIVDSNGNRYLGEFENGQRHGHGEMKYKNGDYYKGTWHKGLKHGLGKMTYSNGTVYDGQWYQNKPRGVCEIKWPSSGFNYEGKIMVTENPSEPNSNSVVFVGHGKITNGTDTYLGHWHASVDAMWERDGYKKLKKNGNGTHIHCNGTVLDGKWEDNVFVSGIGKILYSNGTYIGELGKGGCADGYGIFTQKGSRIKEEGFWENGSLCEKSNETRKTTSTARHKVHEIIQHFKMLNSSIEWSYYEMSLNLGTAALGCHS